MTIICETYLCLECKKGSFSKDEIAEHGCTLPFKVFHSIVECKPKRCSRFTDWLLADWDYYAAFMGAVVINAMLLPKMNLSFSESLLEGLSFGFLLIRLLK